MKIWKKISMQCICLAIALLLGGCHKQNTKEEPLTVDFPYSSEMQSESIVGESVETTVESISEQDSTTAQSSTTLIADTNTPKDNNPDTNTSKDNNQSELDMAQSILQSPGTLVHISNSTQNQSTAYVDLDGDKTPEKILLEPSKDPENAQYLQEDDPLAYYHLQIGNADFEGFGNNIENSLWGISLDGKNILLVLYEDGPSADPYTHLFQYQNNIILEVGNFADDIRACKISSDGIITGKMRKDVVQTDYVIMCWKLNQSGILEEIPQDTYNFQNGNWVDLKENLPLHAVIESTDTFTIPPQKVKFLQTTANENWVLLEAEDGQQGWMQIENSNVSALQKFVMDVFDNLNMTD